MPPMMYSWARTKRMTMGKETMVEPANTAGQLIWLTSRKRAMPTVTGYFFQSERMMRGQTKELHSLRKMKTPSVTMAGLAKGSMMRQ